MLFEGLEPRQLMTTDLSALSRNAASDNSAQIAQRSEPLDASSVLSEKLSLSTTGRSVDLSTLESAYPGVLQEQSKKSIDASVNLSQLTLAPQSITTFRSTMPSVEQVQSSLFGAKLGSQIDWPTISNSGSRLSLSTTDTELAQDLMAGGIEGLLIPSTAIGTLDSKASVRTENGTLSTLTRELSVGSFCRSDGTFVLVSIPSAEGEGDSGEGDSGDGNISVPSPYTPTLYLSGSAGQVQSFSPQDQNSAVTITFGGSFNAASLANPDMNATGDNWVHSINRTWISATQWSITETVIAVYSLGDSQTTNHDLTELGGDDSDSGDSSGEGSGSSGDDEPSDLEEAGAWSSTVSVSRRGFVMMTLHASMGISSPAAAGVSWSMSISYNDSVSVSANAGGNSTFVPNAALTSGSGDSGESGDGAASDSTIPADFNGAAEWSAGFGVSGHSAGVVFISSTPSLALDGSIRRAIVADVSYDIGGNANFSQDWTSSSQSGDLELPDLLPYVSSVDPLGTGNPFHGADLSEPLGNASNEFQGSDLRTRGGTEPSDIVGDIEGYGHVASSGGGGSSRLGGGVTGGFNMQAVIGGSGFESLTGNAFAAMHADTGGAGKSKHFFVYAPEPTVATTAEGLTTSKIVLVNAWDTNGKEDEFSSTLKNENISASATGEMVTDPDGSTAEIDGTADLTGFTILSIVASIKSELDLTGPTSTGSKTHDLTLDYTSIERGQGLGEYRSAVNATTGTAPDLLAGNDGAAISSDINARTFSKIKLVDDKKLLYTNQQDVGSWVNEYKTDDKDKMTVILTSHSTIVGNVTGTLQSDDTVAWTGGADDETITEVDYVRKWKRTDSAISPNESSNYTYVQFRDAEFKGEVEQSSELNTAAGTVLATFSRSGNAGVQAVSSMAGNQELPTQFEKELESIITGATPPEIEVWDPSVGPITSERPSTSYTMQFISWFGGTAGDSADQAIYFTAGVADSITPTSYWVRHGAEYFTGTQVDESGNVYFAGEIVGTVASFVIPSGAAVNKLTNSFDDMGKCVNWLTKLRHGGCFVAGTKVTVSELPYSIERESALWSETSWLEDRPELGEWRRDQTSQSLRSPATALQTSLLVPIEEVPLGARVPTKNPKPWEYDDSLPDPVQDTWVKLSITVERSDGGVVDAELIRPRSWVESNNIRAGQLLPLNIAELQIAGYAHVTAVEPCPMIADGEGSVITGRFVTRQVDVIARVEILGADGSIEVLEGTTIHPIWSLDRNDWVPLGELEVSEQLASQSGPATVLSITILNRPTSVYNIEVHGEHVYEVGELEFLVHNAAPCQLAVVRAATHGATPHTYAMKDFANSLVLAGNTTVRTNQALVSGGTKLANLRPDIQWVQGGKVWIGEVSSLTGNAATRYHVAREAVMRNLLGNSFGGYLPL